MKVTIEISDQEAVDLRRTYGQRKRPDCFISHTPAELRALRLIVDALPRPIQVGDTVVQNNNQKFAYTVAAIDGAYAWLLYEQERLYATALIATLTLAAAALEKETPQ